MYVTLDDAQVTDKWRVIGDFPVLIIGRGYEGGESSPIIKERISFWKPQPDNISSQPYGRD